MKWPCGRSMVRESAQSHALRPLGFGSTEPFDANNRLGYHAAGRLAGTSVPVSRLFTAFYGSTQEWTHQHADCQSTCPQGPEAPGFQEQDPCARWVPAEAGRLH